jgi:hypothetical protein
MEGELEPVALTEAAKRNAEALKGTGTDIDKAHGQPLVLDFRSNNQASVTQDNDLEKFEHVYSQLSGPAGKATFLHIDADDPNNAELLKKYHVTVVPDLKFVNEAGDEVFDRKGAYRTYDLNLKDRHGRIHRVNMMKRADQDLTNDDNIAEGLSKITGQKVKDILKNVQLYESNEYRNAKPDSFSYEDYLYAKKILSRMERKQ